VDAGTSRAQAAAQPSAVQRYARVLRAPDFGRLFSAAILARLPIGSTRWR
jgi:hypothetical protein